MPGRLDYQNTLADYVAIAISPVLIMMLVGSLVFFLLEIFYDGVFHERLRFILAMFVMAAVLIGRISIEEGSERAAVFALALAAVTAMAVYKLVSGDGMLVSLVLMGVIWWCAHKLTWDCTLFDESEDASGEGLLQMAGLDESRPAETSGEQEEPAEPEGVTSPDADALPWWERLRDRDTKRRFHAPGVWIVYFSLAALPVFGIGQRFISAGDVQGRRYAFWLLCVYVASGFGLLLTTSFLGLRRYLRQRSLQMPTSMAGVWMASGCVLIVGLLALAALLPRPASEYAISELPFGIGALDQKSSRHALGEEGVDDPQRQRRAGKPVDERESRSDRAQEDGQPAEDQPGDGSDEEPAQGQTEPQDASGQAEGGGSQQEGASGGEQPQESGSPQEGQNKGQQRGRQSGESRSEDRSSGESRERESASENGETGQEAGSRSAEDEGSPREPRRQPSLLRQMMPQTSGQWLTTLFRWMLFAALILVGGYWLWRSWDKVVAGFRELLDGLRSLLDRLFGAKKPSEAVDEEPEAPEAREAFRPFSAFDDPFAGGMAARCSPGELVRYSFEALEAWAREQGWPREPEQTPHEFAQHVGTRATSLARDARCLADLYCSLAYAHGRLPEASVEHVRRFWRQLGPVASARSAGGV